MTKHELYYNFCRLFPAWSSFVQDYKKIGSRTIVMNFRYDKTSKVFMYYDDNNWQFGTKIWRKRPERKEK